MVNNDLTAQYDLGVKKMQYNRSNYYLDTTKGQYLLRKVNIPREQIAFEYEVNRQLIHAGFYEIGKMYLTKKQNPFALQQDKLYVLQAYKEVEEIDFRAEEDLRQVIAVLARFHKAAKHITSKERHVENASIKNIYQYFHKRTLEGKKMKNSICNMSQKTRFEIMFNEGYKEYERLQQMAMALIDEETAARLVQKAKEEGTIAHNDYTYHALGKTKEGQYVMNHLDACGYNIQLVDVANVLIKIMQKNGWNIKLLDCLIQDYIAINPLTADEWHVLKALLIFPEKFASMCQKYTYSRRRNNYSMFELK